jgi:serine/threonine protein phosphatase PrpC
VNDSGGAEAVSHVEQHLHKHIEQHLIGSSAAEYKHAIQYALKDLDRDLDRDNLHGGSTVSLVLIDTKQNLLIEADLGDSHVFFADHEPRSPQSLSPESPTRVDSGSSAANGPDSPSEKKRIEDSGGEVNYRSGIARIGGVSMSRALGDLEYKKPRVNRLAGHNLADLGVVETGLAPGRTAIYDLVSNTANFAVRQLNGQSLILLASDGVGDAKDAEEVTRLAVSRWQQGTEAKEIAEEITRREGKVQGADNCTVVVIVLDTEGKGRRSIDSGVGRRSLDVSEGGGGGRRRRRSSIASLKDWMSGR